MDVLEPGSLTHPIRFRDPQLDEQFRRDGYLVVPFLDREALRRLRALWEDIRPAEVHGIWSNVHTMSPQDNARIDDTITREFAAPAADLFLDGRLAGASFLVKGTGPNSASTPHQDWCNVEEDSAQSASIWCPLIDVDEDNGALQVIPGSHRLRPSIRSLDTPSLYLDFTPDLEPHLTCVPLRAGEAALYAHNLFHGSKPNLSDQIRPSVVSGVLPHGARHVHYRRSPAGGDVFEVLDIGRSFFLEGIPEMTRGEVPASATVAETIHVERPCLTLGEVLDADPAAPERA